MALAALGEVDGPGMPVLEQVAFERLLTVDPDAPPAMEIELDAGARTVHFELTPIYTFSIVFLFDEGAVSSFDDLWNELQDFDRIRAIPCLHHPE